MVSTAPPSYSHATEPRAVENRKKFREPPGYGNANIMYDRRVVRGSTYSQPIDTPVRRTSPPPPPRAPRILAGRCTAHAVGSPQFLGACGRRLLVPPYLRLPLFSGSLPPAGATTWASACRTCAHFGAADKCQELERTKRMTQAAQRAEMVDGGRARTPDAVEGRKRTERLRGTVADAGGWRGLA
jgi:hypothetical protein